MKKNNKGFMLAELIITSTVIVTAMIGLYTTFNRIYSKYKQRNTYYSINGVYATKEMTDSLLKNNFNTFINNSLTGKHHSYIIENGTCKIDDNNKSICDGIKEAYDVKNMIFTEYNKCTLIPEKCNLTVPDTEKIAPTNQTLKEYIEYLTDYYNFEDTSDNYSYIIITETEEDNNTYYSNIRIR